MQLNSVYLYPNKIDVFTNALASWQTERYRRVYNRNLKIYRSVDNRIDLQVRNSDQKAADITGSTLVFNMITREGKDLVLSKDCTTSSASGGKVYVHLPKKNLLLLNQAFIITALLKKFVKLLTPQSIELLLELRCFKMRNMVLSALWKSAATC